MVCCQEVVWIVRQEYDKRYWQRLEYNWKHWKRVELAGRIKRRLTVVYEVIKEEEGKIEEWNKENKMDCMGDAQNKL